MQFLGCRKVLSYKGLWLVLSSSIASMKGDEGAEKRCKNRGNLVFRGTVVFGRGARLKSFEILSDRQLPSFTDQPNWLSHPLIV